MSPSEHELRQAIVQVGRLMYEKGFICASDGNISARLGRDQLLITPSGYHKGLLEPDQLLVVDMRGRVQRSRQALKPTSELPMHLAAYQRRPEIRAVVHAHPPITIALSIAGIPMADCLLPEVIVSLGLIPTSRYATPSSEENVAAIYDLILYHDAIVLQRHGALTVGPDPMTAFMRLETVEQNARIAYMLAQLGAINPLDAEEVRKLLAQRQALGLSRPGEAERFCDACGVCHTEGRHPSILMDRTPDGGRPQGGATLAKLEPEAIRQLVTDVVGKTLGGVA